MSGDPTTDPAKGKPITTPLTVTATHATRVDPNFVITAVDDANDVKDDDLKGKNAGAEVKKGAQKDPATDKDNLFMENTIAMNLYRFMSSRISSPWFHRAVIQPLAIATIAATSAAHLAMGTVNPFIGSEGRKAHRDIWSQQSTGLTQAALTCLGNNTVFWNQRVIPGAAGEIIGRIAEARKDETWAQNELARREKMLVSQPGIRPMEEKAAIKREQQEVRSELRQALVPNRSVTIDPKILDRATQLISDFRSKPPSPPPADLPKREIALAKAYLDKDSFLGKAYENYKTANKKDKVDVLDALKAAERAAKDLIADTGKNFTEVRDALNKSSSPPRPR